MPGRKIIIVFCLICFVSSASREQQHVSPPPKPAAKGAGAAQPVAPPPKPVDDGPNLQITMKFIQDKLSHLGPIKYTSTLQVWDLDPVVDEETEELSNVVADAKGCTISYHDQTTVKGDKPTGYDLTVPLKDVEKITVLPHEQHLNDRFGTSTAKYTVRPAIFDVVLGFQTRGAYGRFSADDEELANRLARAFNHAVELCTSDKKADPF